MNNNFKMKKNGWATHVIKFGKFKSQTGTTSMVGWSDSGAVTKALTTAYGQGGYNRCGPNEYRRPSGQWFYEFRPGGQEWIYLTSDEQITYLRLVVQTESIEGIA